MIKLIGFDLDDTLWDLHPVMINAERVLDKWLKTHVPHMQYSVLEMRKLRPALLRQEPSLQTQITELRRRIIETAMTLSKIPQKKAYLASTEAIEVFLEARNNIQLFDGAEAVLKQLKESYNLCALTNGNAKISRLGLTHLFNFSFSAEELQAPKPAPDLFLHALRHEGISAAEMIYVGDDPAHDIDAAACIGIKTIWMNRGKKPISQYAPDQIITDISQLPEAVQKIST